MMIDFDVVLSTYNGEAYLVDQVNSLLIQKNYIQKIYIRDDGSSDGTVKLINHLVTLYPSIFIFIEDNKGNLGPKKSFLELCSYTTSNYVALADQDDIWEENKLEVLDGYIKQHELLHHNKPILIHSDLSLIDENACHIGSSYLKASVIDVRRDSINDLLINRNVVTGCACVVNRALLDVASRVDDSPFHLQDYFFACIAAMFHGIHYIDVPLVKYRQHSNNCVGFQSKITKLRMLKKMVSLRFGVLEKLYKINVYCSYDWLSLSKKIDVLLISFDIDNRVTKKDKIKLRQICYLAKQGAFYRFFHVFTLAKLNKTLPLRFRSIKRY